MFRYVFLVPRYVKRWFYQKWNRFKFRASGVKLGRSSSIYNSISLLVHKGATVCIGDNFQFSSVSTFNPLIRNMGGAIYCGSNGRIEIGDNVGASSTCLWCVNQITIGNHVKFGAGSVVLDNDAHSLDYTIRREPQIDIASSAPVCIEDDVLVGAGSIILKGVTIGERSIIGAGSVVTKDIPADCIAAGNPCKVIRKIENNQLNCNQ